MTSRELLFAGRYSEARAAAAAAAGIEDYPDSAQIAKNPGECIIWAAAQAAELGAPGAAALIARLRKSAQALSGLVE